MKLGYALVMSLAMMASSGAFAAFGGLSCDGSNIENLKVGFFTADGPLMGDVAWDCFPGGGICNQSVALASGPKDDGSDSVVYEGPGFKLTIDLSHRPPGPDYPSHISATDMNDQDGMGKGLKVEEDVMCRSVSL